MGRMTPHSKAWERLANELARERAIIVPCTNRACRYPNFDGYCCRFCDCSGMHEQDEPCTKECKGLSK